MRAETRQAAFNVRAPTLSRTVDGKWRVVAEVDGRQLHLTADAPLAVNADAFVAAFLLPAAKSGALLSIDSDVDAQLLANTESIRAIVRRDWGWSGRGVAPRGVVSRSAEGSEAMFFTGGVDSFYSLLRRRECIDRLIFIEGVDLSLDDAARFATLRAWIEGVASETGLRAVFPQTNLRRHPSFVRIPWERSFGSALASVAHMMAPTTSTVYIASSGLKTAHGSSPELDPLWSSGAVAIVHDGVEASRLDKARAICDWPLVHRSLRVCFADRTSTMNCGVCEKCVRTQATFAVIGRLDRITTFPRRASLAELIDGVSHITPAVLSSWMTIRTEIADVAVVAAVDRLLARRESRVDRLREAAKPWIEPWIDRAPGGRALWAVGKRLLRR